jgi:hypothetical protein
VVVFVVMTIGIFLKKNLVIFIDGEVMVFLSWIWRILMMDVGSIVDIVGTALVKGGISFHCGFWC